MNDIREYLFSIITAAVICAISINLTSKNNTVSALIKLLAGVFLSITIISPWVRLRIHNLDSYLDRIHTDSEQAAQQGITAASNEIAVIISDRIQAYILDKAWSLGVEPEVLVACSDVAPYEIHTVTLKGDISPYAKNKLKQVICDDLGLTEDKLLWQ